MKKIILIGGGGHCKSCIDVIEKGNQYLYEKILIDFTPLRVKDTQR
jgi:hypothetical protein